MKLEELVGKPITEAQFDEAAGKKDACYRKVKARYDVWPSAYASGALVKCRKVGAANWGNKSKKESVKISTNEACWVGYKQVGMKDKGGKKVPNCVKKEGVDTTMTMEQAGMIADNICVNCGDFANENLRKWFSDRWVNIGKKKKGGGHPPCGTSGKKRGYAKCVPASKAAGMSKKQKASATRRKRAAQNKAGRGGTSNLRGGGKKPIRVSTKPKK